MHCMFDLVLLLNVLFVKSQTQTQALGNCSHDNEPLQCCRNYRRRGDLCEECWPGTFGIRCQDDCPDGLYGRFCGEVCDCPVCDKVYGCQLTSNQTDKDVDHIAENTSPGNSYQDNFYTDDVIIASSLAGSLTFMILIVLCCTLRNRTLVTDSSMNKGREQTRTTSLYSFAHNSPSSRHATNGGPPVSTIHGWEWEPSDRQMCSQQNDFADNSLERKENSHAMLSTSESVYSHLNMDEGQYHRLGLTFNNSQETNEELSSTQTSNTCCNNADSRCSSKMSEKKYSKALNKNLQTADNFEAHSTPETENITIGMSNQDRMPSIKPKKLPRKLYSFKLSDDIECNI